MSFLTLITGRWLPVNVCIFSSGATRTKDARELLYARQKVVMTTKAFGLQAIDLVYIDYKDVEGLRQQAREGALMGFTGTPTTSSPTSISFFFLNFISACRLHTPLISAVYSCTVFLNMPNVLQSAMWHNNTLLSAFSCEHHWGNATFPFSLPFPLLVSYFFPMRIGNELADTC